MVALHDYRISGAVWFKHRYLTNLLVTPADCTTGAIGGLAKTLTTGIPPQLHNSTLDKLRRLHNILAPQVDNDNNRPMLHVTKIPIAVPRVANNNVSSPRVPPQSPTYDYALSPRVLLSPTMDKTKHMLPLLRLGKQHQLAQPPVVPVIQSQGSTRLMENIVKLRVDVSNLKEPSVDML